MKKSLKKVLAVIMAVVLVITGTSLVCFAADNQETNAAVAQALSDWLTALSKIQVTDFYGIVSGILHLFGFKGDFTGFQSMSELADEWFAMFGGLGSIYESFVNMIDTKSLVRLLNEILAGMHE